VNERGKLVEATGQLFDDLVMEVSAYARDDDMAQVTKELSVFANRLIPYGDLADFGYLRRFIDEICIVESST